ncbi:MAG: hypothetical protein ACE5FO_04050 [Parvularculaceae bacterium]
MELVTNFMLLAATGAACLYCWILSKRLKGLTSAKSGFGAGVAALSKSAEEMKQAMEKTRTAGEETAARLESLLRQADMKSAQLRALTKQLRDMSASVVSDTGRATTEYADTLTPLIGDANDAANRLIEALEQTSSGVRESAGHFVSGASVHLNCAHSEAAA